MVYDRKARWASCVNGKTRKPFICLFLVGLLAWAPACGSRAGETHRGFLRPARAISISAGGDQACAILADRTVRCWGSNLDGSLGNGKAYGSTVPVRVRNLHGVRQLSVGIVRSCALVAGGKVKCWGLGERVSVAVKGISGARQVSAGGALTACALMSDRAVRCWKTGKPFPVRGIRDAIAIGAGRDHACALLSSGEVECWGGNLSGQLGDGTQTDSATPVRVAGIDDAISISVADFFTCALISGGKVKCWGNNDRDQLGEGSGGHWRLMPDGQQEISVTPVLVNGIEGATAVFTGGGSGDIDQTTRDGHTCVLFPGGTIKCWGDGLFGELGFSPTLISNLETDYYMGFETSARPLAVERVSGVNDLALGGASSCALERGGSVECWGNNRVGQLGNGTRGAYNRPVEVNGIDNASSVIAGDFFSCALLSNQEVDCWGAGDDGRLGNGSLEAEPSPVAVKGIANAISIGGGGANVGGATETWTGQTCAVLSTGTIKCWGSRPLGDGSKAERGSSMPVTVKGITTADTVAFGGDNGAHACATVRSGMWASVPAPLRSAAAWLEGVGSSGDRVECWGSSLTPLPKPVEGIADARSVASGDGFSCAVLSDGKVDCWGNDEGGPYAVPAGYQAVKNAVVVSAGSGFACALRSTGRVVCWGDDQNGQLGDGNGGAGAIPGEVEGIRGAVALSSSSQASCAVLRDGTVWCWGIDWDGVLGGGASQTEAFSPVRIKGVSMARTVSVGSSHACASLTDGRVECWGSNSYGQLGNGGIDYNPVPVGVVGLS